jgi:hypothetical protein
MVGLMIINRQIGKYIISIYSRRIRDIGVISIHCLPFIRIKYQPSDCSDEPWWYWALTLHAGWLVYEIDFTLIKDIFYLDV